MSTQTFDHVQTNTLTVGDVRVTGAALTTLMAGNNSTLSIDLSDEEGARALFIEEPTENTLNVAIQNEAAVDVTFVAKTGTPSNSNYHIKLQFSTGFGVTAATLAFAKSVKGWTAVLTKSRGRGTLYLLNTSGLTLTAFGQPGDEIELPLVYTNVTPAGGALQSRVSVAVNPNTAFVKDANNGKVTVERADKTQFLELVKTGKPAPLALELVGRRTICNDGTAHTLTLQLKNLLDDGPIKLAPTTGTAPPTQLIISFDKAGTKWSLGTQAEIDGITVSPPSGWNNTSNKWLLKTTNTSLARNGTVQITLGTVKSTLAPGFANVYVRYKDLPGYGDGVLVAQIEKSPLLYSDAAGSGMTLNGTTGSNNALSIGVNATGEGLRIEQKGTGNSAYFEGGCGVRIKTTTTDNTLVAEGGTGVRIENIKPNANGLSIGPINSAGAGLYIDQQGGGHSAYIQGGAGVRIVVRNLKPDTPEGSYNGLCIDGMKSSQPALRVIQSGSGPTASFNGGEGVWIETETKANSLIASGGAGVCIQNVKSDASGLVLNPIKTSAPALFLKQGGTGYAAHFMGGKGVLIGGVKDGQRGLEMAVTTSSQALYVKQTGAGNSAHFEGGEGVWIKTESTSNTLVAEGGAGVCIQNVKSDANGLVLDPIKSSNEALFVNQQGTGNSAHFQGGKGVHIYVQDVRKTGGSYHGLLIDGVRSTASALFVNQEGAGYSGWFQGGKGVHCDKLTMGSTTITETELEVLKKLAGNELYCWISNGGYRLDRYELRSNESDSARFNGGRRPGMKMKLTITE